MFNIIIIIVIKNEPLLFRNELEFTDEELAW
jgi:hypothetical protein